jgi:hypothetical protein
MQASQKLKENEHLVLLIRSIIKGHTRPNAQIEAKHYANCEGILTLRKRNS